MKFIKCKYCDSEFEVSDKMSACPNCSAGLDLDTINFIEDSGEPTNQTDYQTDAQQTFVQPANKHPVLLTLSIIFGFFLLCVTAGTLIDSVEKARETGFGYYTETGHNPGESYSGIKLTDTDLTDYVAVSWTKEPHIQWGDKDNYSANMLYISARLHNNTSKDIKSVSIAFDALDKDGNAIGHTSMFSSSLLAGQDNVLSTAIYMRDHKTYSDIAEMRMTRVDVYM